MEEEQTQEAIKEHLTGRAEQNQTSSLSLNCFSRYLFGLKLLSYQNHNYGNHSNPHTGLTVDTHLL